MFDDFYGLAGKPFQLTPDPAFYFRSITHRKALSYLGYGLAQGEGFIVITGEVGAGKSTLVAHLMGTIDPGQLTVAQIVTSKLDEEEIIHVVAQSFGLDIEGHDKASALGAIEGFLHAEARAGHRCLLIVDESQNLSVAALEELRMLSNFQLGSHPLLQTLLLGQPEFRATLQGHASLEQLRQRVIAAHHLEAMERSEIEPYIMHRLNRVGWNGNPQFDQRVFNDLYEASGGIPRRLNQIANRLLLLGAVEQRSRIDASMLQVVMDEMAGERTMPQGALRAVKRAEAPASVASPAPLAAAPAPFDPALVEAMLASRDAQIAQIKTSLDRLADRDETIAMQPLLTERDAKIAELQDMVAVLSARDESLSVQPLLAERDAQIAELRDAVVQLSARDDSAGVQPMLAERDEQIAALQQAVGQLSMRDDSAAIAPLLAQRDAQIAELQGVVAQLAARDDSAAMQPLLAERDAQIAELQDVVAQLSARDTDASIQRLLAERDARIAELQQAFVEMSAQYAEPMAAAAQPDLSPVQDRLARMESRVLEQERTIRQTLTMLIDWFDSDMDQSRAA